MIMTLTVKMVVTLPDGIEVSAIAADRSSSEAWLVLHDSNGDEVWSGRAEDEWIASIVPGEEEQPL